MDITLGKGLAKATTVFDLEILDLIICLLALEGECTDQSLEIIHLHSHMVMKDPKPRCEE